MKSLLFQENNKKDSFPTLGIRTLIYRYRSLRNVSEFVPFTHIILQKQGKQLFCAGIDLRQILEQIALKKLKCYLSKLLKIRLLQQITLNKSKQLSAGIAQIQDLGSDSMEETNVAICRNCSNSGLGLRQHGRIQNGYLPKLLKFRTWAQIAWQNLKWLSAETAQIQALGSDSMVEFKAVIRRNFSKSGHYSRQHGRN